MGDPIMEGRTTDVDETTWAIPLWRTEAQIIMDEVIWVIP